MTRRKRKQARGNKLKNLITQLNPRSPIAEQYRTIRTNIEFSSVDEEVRSIIVTSSSPEEGKSMTAANLAIVYAQQGKRVLLIDADLRKPTVHYTFRLDNLRGLSNLLVSQSQLEGAISDTQQENLHVISSGPIPPNPSELLGSNKMKSLINEAKKVYDIIILDTPPVLAVTDAQVLANIVDGSILVVRSDQTEYELATKATETLKTAQAKILGAVLNDREQSASNTYYYYGQ